MLYDYLNRPVQTAVLKREIAAPTLAGVRTIWNDTVASGLTPSSLAGLLLLAAEGDHYAYLTLAEEMEERDLHYAAELSKRKLAVSRLPVTVESASDDAADLEKADAVRKLLGNLSIRALLKNLLDAVGKGYACVEIIWEYGELWKPVRFAWRDPHFFQFDQVTMQEIRLRDEADLMNGLALPPYKFLCHINTTKSGLPIRGGIARLAAWAYMCKGYTVKDWLAFAEVFGMPLRLGKYGASASKPEIDILKTAVANLGTDAAAVFPDSMQVELIEAGNKSGNADFFERLAKYLDDQVSKGIIGQTASSSGTAGKLGNEDLQAEVRDDIRDDDAEALEDTLNRDLVRPFIDLNWGPQEQYPSVQLRAIKNEDVTALVNSVAKLVPMGLRVEQSVLRDKLGLPDPAPDALPEDLLQPTPGAASLQQQPLPQAQNRMALNSMTPMQFTEEQQALEELADKALAGTNLNTNEALLLNAIMRAENFDEVLARLKDLYPSMDMDKLQDMLTRSLVAAELTGRKMVQDADHT